MLDRPVRRVLQPWLAALVRPLVDRGVRPNHLTVVGLVLAIIAAVLAARQQTVASAAFWLVSRLVDGLDGEAARAAPSSDHDRDLGGFYDIIADFAAYAAVPIGIAVAQADARLAITFLLGTYYLSGSTFLAFSSIAERRSITTDARSFQFIGRLAEGTETIVVTTAMLLWPASAEPIAWVFAGVVGVGVVERVLVARRLVRQA